MITHFVISTQTINSSSSQKGEKAIEISASVFRSKIRVLMSPDSAIGSTKRPLGGHLYGFLQRRARVITMDLVGSPGVPSATHELVRRLLRLPHIIGNVTTDYGSRCISVGQCNKRNQEIKERNWGGTTLQNSMVYCHSRQTPVFSSQMGSSLDRLALSLVH